VLSSPICYSERITRKKTSGINAVLTADCIQWTISAIHKWIYSHPHMARCQQNERVRELIFRPEYISTQSFNEHARSDFTAGTSVYCQFTESMIRLLPDSLQQSTISGRVVVSPLLRRRGITLSFASLFSFYILCLVHFDVIVVMQFSLILSNCICACSCISCIFVLYCYGYTISINLLTCLSSTFTPSFLPSFLFWAFYYFDAASALNF